MPTINWGLRSSGYLGAYIGEVGPHGKRKNVYKHRWVWEQVHGPIPKGFVVHHKDKNKLNNKIGNLEILEKCAHSRIHKPVTRHSGDAKHTYTIQCVECGIEMVRGRVDKHPRCTRCHQHIADVKRSANLVHCAYCGKSFRTRGADYCSPRCVNLGARWK